MNWVKNHQGALIAFAGAIGIFAHAISPEFAAASGENAHKLMTVVAVIGTVLEAYAGGSEDNG